MSVVSAHAASRSASGWLWPRVPAWGLAAASLALSVGAIALAALNHWGGPTTIFPPDLEGGILFPIIGAVIITSRPRNTIGWILCAAGFCLAITVLAPQYLTYTLQTQPGSLPLARLMVWLDATTWPLGIVLGLTFVPLFFPDGRFLSPRWRWVAWVAMLALALCVIPSAVYLWGAIQSGQSPQHLYTVLNSSNPPALLAAVIGVGFPLLELCVLLAVISLVLRFLRSAGTQRQQIKWFAYASALLALTLGFDVAQSLLLDSQLDILSGVLLGVAFPLLVMAIGIAILRYQLWDIDVIINRTLVYGSLTAILAAVYFGCVVAVQALGQALTGDRSLPPVAVVISTLLVAALFTPARRRLQRFIDRRFYRRKYDAAKTLARFSAALRSEVDLQQLREQLITVVDDTMHPAHVSLWLHDGAPITARTRVRREGERQ